jgi:large subunit ribosomal protein L21
MYAVIRTGGKQYRVAKDDTLAVEKLAGEPGETLTFEVMAIGEGEQLTLGQPLVQGAAVTAEIVEQGRADKILVFKKKRRQNYRRKKGHRQHETLVKITGITA